jgi:hypothetical protein
MEASNNKPYLYTSADIQKYQNRIVSAVAVIVAAIVVGSILGNQALKCHTKIQENWETIHWNRAIHNNFPNIALHEANSVLIKQGWAYFGGARACAAAGFTALGFGVHALVHREKAKTQLEGDSDFALQRMAQQIVE